MGWFMGVGQLERNTSNQNLVKNKVFSISDFLFGRLFPSSDLAEFYWCL